MEVNLKELKSNKSGWKKKLAWGVLLVIAILVLGFNKIVNLVDYYYVWGGGLVDKESAELERMINSVLGVPYAQKPEFKNDAPGIARLTKEEWFALPYLDNALTIDFVADEDELLSEPMPQPSEAKHADSLGVWGIVPYVNPPKPVYYELCPNALTCQLLTIAVKDYALQRPEILENILKIAERPCDYIRNIEEVKPEDQIVFINEDYKIFKRRFITKKYKREDIEIGIEDTKQFLGCKKNKWNDFFALNSPSFFKKKYVLIVVNKTGMITKNDEKSIDIIVARKDI